MKVLNTFPRQAMINCLILNKLYFLSKSNTISFKVQNVCIGRPILKAENECCSLWRHVCFLKKKLIKESGSRQRVADSSPRLLDAADHYFHCFTVKHWNLQKFVQVQFYKKTNYNYGLITLQHLKLVYFLFLFK